MSERNETPARTEAWLRPLVLLLLGGGVLLLTLQRYPPRLGHLAPFPRSLDPGKIVEALHALLLVLVLDLGAYGLGLGLERRLCPGGGGDLRHLYRLGLGLLLLPPVVLLLGALHLLTPHVLSGLLTLPAVAIVVLRFPRIRGRLDRRPGAGRRAPSRWILLPLVAGAVLLLDPLLQALGPRVGWDALTYHLALPETYLRRNAIEVSPFSLYSAFPGAMEMLTTLLLGAGGGDVAAKLLHFQLGLLTLVGLYLLGRRHSPACAALAPALLLSCPLFVQETAWAYNDLNGAFYALLALAALSDGGLDGERPALVRCGLAAGACLATRYLGGLVLLGLLAVVWTSAGAGPWRRRARASLWIGGVAALCLAPWLLRNALQTGNPVSPALQGLFHAPGAEFFDPVAVEQNVVFDRRIGMGRDLGALLLLPWNLTLETRPGVYGDSFAFRVSPMYLVGLLGVLLVRRRPRSPEIDRALVFVAACTLIWFGTFQEPRFLLPAFPLLALAGAWALDRLGTRPALRAALLALPLGALVLNALPAAKHLGRHLDLALGPLPHADELSRFPAWTAGEALRERLGPGDRLLLLLESRRYFFRGIDTIPWQPNEGPPVLQRIHRAESVPALRRELRELGVTHVLLDNRAGVLPLTVPGYSQADLEADLERIRRLLRGAGRPLYDADGILVVALGDAG